VIPDVNNHFSTEWPKSHLTYNMLNSIFWDKTKRSPTKVKRRFGGTCRLHLAWLLPTLTLFSCLAYSSTLKMETTCSSETSVIFNGLRSVISEKTELFRLTILEEEKKGKAIPVIGCGGRSGCETTRLPHFLDNRLTDGGEAVSLTRRPPYNPRNIPGTHFC
jgi:hypothetical protein